MPSVTAVVQIAKSGQLTIGLKASQRARCRRLGARFQWIRPSLSRPAATISELLVVRRANIRIEQAECLASNSFLIFRKRQYARRESTTAKLWQCVDRADGAGRF